MKIGFKILIQGLLLLGLIFNGRAKDDFHTLPVTNKLILNPSFGGLNKNTSLWTGLHYTPISNQEVYHRFYMTYDTYSEKLKGGIGFYYIQGLIGNKNINTNEIGISYAGLKIKAGKANIIPSLQTNLLLGTKQWYVYTVDYMLDKEIEPPSPPGEDFKRYVAIKPVLGILWDSPKTQTGLTFTLPVQKTVASDEKETIPTVNISSASVLLYLAQKTRGKRNGLVSQKFEAYPELLVYLNRHHIFSRTSVKIERVDKTLGLFIENDYTDNNHRIGGTYGWRKDYFLVNLTAAAGLPFISNTVTFSGEITLGLVIPPVWFSEKKPWTPERKFF